MSIEKKLNVKNIVAIISTVFMIMCFFLTPFKGLEKEGMVFLGIFIWWVVMMVTNIMPTYLASLVAAIICVAAKVTTFGTAFSAFSGTTIWLMIGAFGLAAGLSASGVVTRIALNVIRLFPGTYVGQLSAVTAASLILLPTLPDPNAKVALLMPIVNHIFHQMGYEPHSKGVTGLSSMTAVVAQFLSRVFFTGTVDPALCLSVAVGLSMGWVSWLKFTCVFGLAMIVLLFLIHLIYFNPDRGKAKEDRVVIGKEVIEARINELPKMDWKEIMSLVVLVVTIILWITESSHGIPAAAIAVGVWCVFMMMNLFQPQDIATKIPWPVILFAGSLIGVSGCISSTGVGLWIAQLVAPVITPLASSPLLILLLISLVCHILKFASVNFLVASAIFVSMLSSVSTVSPLCIVFAALAGSATFVLEYQSFAMVTSLALTGDRVTFKDLKALPWLYIVASLASIAISVPWWSMIGYIG